MKSIEGCAPKRMFLDIPNAADLAGFSVRHFRRIIEDEQIRIVQIGRKFFILGADFEKADTLVTALLGPHAPVRCRARTSLVTRRSREVCARADHTG